MHDRIPVIVGVGESIDRPQSSGQALEPLVLMQRAAQQAQQDAGAALLAQVDALDIVCQLSWPYVDTPGKLSDLLCMKPAWRHVGQIGGETPTRFLHDAALRISRGESRVALVVGAEAEYSVAMARKADIVLPWQERDTRTVYPRGKDFLHPIAVKYGIATPGTVYPLIENAAQAAWGQTPAEGQAESAALWAEFSRVAADNPFAWLPHAHSPEDISTPSARNRLVAWPYTKRMIANPMVNQGAAVLLTSLAHARNMGVPASQLVFFVGGAAANERRDFLLREHLHRSYAQELVLERAEALLEGAGFDALELYSCFPVVPKRARMRAALRRPAPTVTGGLSFFGAPLNNYMTHAAAAMVRVLRRTPGGNGLLYGQGEYMTKHHGLVLTADAGRGARPLRDEGCLQERADTLQPPAPALLAQYQGAATLETCTVVFARDGTASAGIVVARTPQRARLVAKVPGADAEGIGRLLQQSASPVGETGRIDLADDGCLVWRFGP